MNFIDFKTEVFPYMLVENTKLNRTKTKILCTSSNIYSGAGLKRSKAKISESASRDLCPPLSSDNDCFQTLPNATRTSRPSKKLQPSGGSSFAIVPGNKVENMDPKSLKHFVKQVLS